MTAAFRGISGLSYGARTNTTIAKPSGTIEGDTLTLAFLLAGVSMVSAPAYTLPDGFVLRTGFPSLATDGGFFGYTYVADKVATDSEPADYTITHGAMSSDALLIATAGTTLTGTQQTAATGGNNISTAPGITPLEDGALFIWLGHNWDLYGTGATPVAAGGSPSFTSRANSGTSLMYAATGVQATAAATGDVVQNPNDNDAASTSRWTAVLLCLEASGDAPTTVPVPDVLGQSEASAIAEIEAAGLVAESTDAYSETIPAGDVVSQDPAAGVEVEPGSSVAIVVSIGVEPEPSLVWDHVLSNGKTAGENLVEINAGVVELLARAPFDQVIEGTYTAADMLRILAAVAAGRTTITKTGSRRATVEFESIDGTGATVTAEMTGSERTGITLAP